LRRWTGWRRRDGLPCMYEPTHAPCWCDRRRLVRRLAETIDEFLNDEAMRAPEAKWVDTVAADIVDEAGLAECPRCKEEVE